jgi:hypothetical protein
MKVLKCEDDKVCGPTIIGQITSESEIYIYIYIFHISLN